MACKACKLNDSSPRNFLLKCSACSTSWHHRCHVPVVQDRDLVSLIRASTRGDHKNGLVTWKCFVCQSTPTSVSAPTLLPPTPLVDLTLSDDDEDQHNIPIPAANLEDLTATNPDMTQAVSRLGVAPNWLHKRYLDNHFPDPWDHLVAKKLAPKTRLNRKMVPSRHLAPPDRSFVIVSADWLRARQEEI